MIAVVTKEIPNLGSIKVHLSLISKFIHQYNTTFSAKVYSLTHSPRSVFVLCFLPFRSFLSTVAEIFCLPESVDLI